MTPEVLNDAKWPFSHARPVSYSEASTTQPRPVPARRTSAARMPMAAHMPVP